MASAVSSPEGAARATNVVGTTVEAYQYDGLSRLVRGTDNNDPTDLTDDSTITYAYDSLGRIVEEAQEIGATNTLAVDSAWAGLNRVGVTYPNGRQITRAFDPLHRLAAVSDSQTVFGTISSNTPMATYSYIGGRVAQRAYPQNGTILDFFGQCRRERRRL